VPCRVVSCRALSCRVVSCRVVSCRVASRRVASCYVISYYIYHVMSYIIYHVSYHIILKHFGVILLCMLHVHLVGLAKVNKLIQVQGISSLKMLTRNKIVLKEGKTS
jgi:hypothetical protein